MSTDDKVTVTTEGRVCHRCRGTKRYISTGRCVKCMREWVVKSVNCEISAERKLQTGNPCAICDQAMNPAFYDHDENTGEFRGWLCRNCNLAIGYLKESVVLVERTMQYLKLQHN